MKYDGMLRISESWFRLLLRLYPRDFRDEMGEGFLQTYRDRCRMAVKPETRFPLLSLGRVWFTAIRESLRNGPAERLRPAASWRRPGNWAADTERVMRRLGRAPVFVAAVVATLAIGLGGFALVYTAVDKILLEPMPYRNPGDLYFVWRDYRAYTDLSRGWLAGPDIAELQKAGGAIEEAVGMQQTGPTLSLTRDGEPQQIRLMLISPNLFDLLGVAPALGRNFERQEVGPQRPSIVILTNKLWKRLGSNPGIVGSEVWLSGSPYKVIGVMPESFRFAMHSSLGAPQEPDLYTTFRWDLSTRSPNDGAYAALIRARHVTGAAGRSSIGRRQVYR
jgi:putative ABC transport system permease protein